MTFFSVLVIATNCIFFRFIRFSLILVNILIQSTAMTTLQLSIPPSLSLLIVAKAKMNYGLCYMGFDASSNTLVRPLYSAVEHKQCWPRDNDFFVGETIIFTVICAYPGQSSLPHSNEDILVNSVETRSYPATFLPTVMYETLSKLSSPTVEAIFGIQNILKDEGRREGVSFVREGTACPSVGIYSCNGENITLYEFTCKGKIKKRFKVTEPSTCKVYDFSITAEDYQQPKSDDSVLLLLGLGRPWVKDGQPEPIRRCYIFVIGMITKPSDSNMSQVDQLSQLINLINLSTSS